MSKRGYIPEDEKQFTGRQLEQLKKAAAFGTGEIGVTRRVDCETYR